MLRRGGAALQASEIILQYSTSAEEAIGVSLLIQHL